MIIRWPISEYVYVILRAPCQPANVNVVCAKIDAVCCLQFSLLFAVSKMSLFCTEINYSSVSSFVNKYLLKIAP